MSYRNQQLETTTISTTLVFAAEIQAASSGREGRLVASPCIGVLCAPLSSLAQGRPVKQKPSHKYCRGGR
eukprot:6962035-Pyramimonas_sp.AAC.1